METKGGGGRATVHVPTEQTTRHDERQFLHRIEARRGPGHGGGAFNCLRHMKIPARLVLKSQETISIMNPT